MKHAAELDPGHEAATTITERRPKEDADGIPENVRSVLDAAQGAAKPKAVSDTSPFGQLGLGVAINIHEAGVDVRVGSKILTAEAHPTLHRSVLETACRTGEPVLIEQGEGGKLIVMGALRTAPTPGVDRIEDLEIEANRIELRGRKEVVLTTGVASIAIRAVGEIETYADRIVSRAEELHKIVGRMLRLN